jgi:uncharacterized protein (DUF2345 family)
MGRERLWLRAEREHRLHVKGSSSVEIEGDASVAVGGRAEVEVAKSLGVSSGSFHQQTGSHEVRTTRSVHSARDEMRLESDAIVLEGKSSIRLVCGGSQITLTPGGITVSAGKVTIEGGEVKIAAQGVVDVDGALITLN